MPARKHTYVKKRSFEIANKVLQKTKARQKLGIRIEYEVHSDARHNVKKIKGTGEFAHEQN
jgi:hypothetical protein